ncbi:MAG TPA: DUF1850 domain-containing protein [Tissierellaceae bacterium]|nr:DUF1850 domain-containing protein [Tissierellaceae bacterium]
MMSKDSNNKYFKGQGIGKLSNTLPYLIILLILIAVIYLLFPVKVLKASNFSNNEYLKAWKIKNGQVFSIEYIHSVEQSPVIENFLVKGRDIILQDTYFHSYGAGLPATTPYKFEITEDGLRVYDINLKIEDLIYRTSGEGREHKLILGNKEYMFLDFSPHRTGVKFDIGYMINLSYFIKEGDLF